MILIQPRYFNDQNYKLIPDCKKFRYYSFDVYDKFYVVTRFKITYSNMTILIYLNFLQNEAEAKLKF